MTLGHELALTFHRLTESAIIAHQMAGKARQIGNIGAWKRGINCRGKVGGTDNQGLFRHGLEDLEWQAERIFGSA